MVAAFRWKKEYARGVMAWAAALLAVAVACACFSEAAYAVEDSASASAAAEGTADTASAGAAAAGATAEDAAGTASEGAAAAGATAEDAAGTASAGAAAAGATAEDAAGTASAGAVAEAPSSTEDASNASESAAASATAAEAAETESGASSAAASNAASSGAAADAVVEQDAPAYTHAAEDDDGPDNRIDPTQRADNSFIYDTTIESLFEQSSLYEGTTVQVVGEVIGDLISAGDEGGREMYWIMLTSTDVENKSSISVLISAEQAKQIDHFGRYGVVGTTLQVRGTFHQACVDHQGLPDIHATDTSPMARGVEHPDTFSAERFAPGIITVLIGVVLMGIYYFARERSR